MSKEPPHNPKIAILTCADARLEPHTFFPDKKKSKGKKKQLFVVRVAGNVADTNGIASLEYAVGTLKTKVIWVIGHENCGAVGAACKLNTGQVLPPQLTPDLVHLIADILPAVGDCCKGKSLEKAIKKNARMNARRLVKQSKDLRQAVAAGDLVINAGYYSWNRTIKRLLTIDKKSMDQ